MNSLSRFLPILFACVCISAEASPFFDLKGRKNSVAEEYLKLHRSFSKQVCRSGVEQNHQKLFRDFQKTRLFIPTTVDGNLDNDSVQKYIKDLKKKQKWLTEVRDDLRKRKSFKNELSEIRAIRTSISKLLKYKRNYNLADKKVSKDRWALQSKKERLRLKQRTLKLFSKVPFLLSYEYPVDHLYERLRYDTFKESKVEKEKKLANEIYLKRRLHEDGATNSKGKKSDKYLRTTINTIYFKLLPNHTFLSENLRYDLLFVLDGLKKQLRSGKKYMLSRAYRYHKRIDKNIEFYEHLNDSVQNETIAGKLLKEKAKATFELKKFSLKKQSEVYQYWSNKPELMRAIFSLETILYNEVGRADPYYYERRDISKVVMNRKDIPLYSEIDLSDSISYYLPAKLTQKKRKFPWLNTLFKEGEFSFTYFYIPANVRIFCPEMTKVGKSLRQKNVNLILNMLGDNGYDFEGLRYFSRESMIGRIDMSSVWKNFAPVKEAPGNIIRRNSYLKKMYQKGYFDYLYHFIDRKGDKYEVVSIKDKEYVFSEDAKRVYRYRNPHKFKYFELR